MSARAPACAWPQLAAVLCLALGLAACEYEGTIAPERAIGDAAAGRRAMQAHGCAACHRIPGLAGPRGAVGPPLDAWSRRAYVAGHLPNEPDALVRWLVDPPSIVPGTAMPDTGVTDREARDIAAYLYRLD